jgi:Predicted nucleoside-diphosphate sugar epimerases
MKDFFIKICCFIFGKQASNSFPRSLILLLDMTITITTYVLAVFMVTYNHSYSFHFYGFFKRFVLVMAVYLASYFVFKTYKGMVRFAGFTDIRKLISACGTAALLLFLLKFLISNFDPALVRAYFPPYTVILYHFAMTFFALTLVRLIVRRIYNEFFKKGRVHIMNVVIYGVGDGGIVTYRALSQDTSLPYKVVAFIDDNPKADQKNINGIPIYNPKKVLKADFIKHNRIEAMIIAIPSLDERKRREIIQKGLDLELKVKSVPQLSQWINNDLKSDQIRDIQIEDLLGREPIILGNENVSREIKNRVVMVTGAAGSIGSEICRQIMHYNPAKLILVDQAESPMYDLQFEFKSSPSLKENFDKMVFVIANVKDKRRMDEIFNTYRPNLIYHAAAYKHVPFMEEHPYEAVYVNVEGTKNIADLAIQYHVDKFVMISTDKAVNPTNVMGATKRIAEIYTQSRNSSTKFITTRFGNVLGSNGSVVPLFKKQLAAGGPLTITDKRIIRYFMTIPEACSLVMEAGSIGDDDDIFVFDMGKPVKIYDLAVRMIQLSGLKDIEIKEIGLRPGEKLYEELLATKENTIPTENKK